MKLLVHLHEPFIECKDPLDIPLADTASRGRTSLRLWYFAFLQLLKCIFSHEVLADHDEISQIRKISIGGILTDHPHLSPNVVLLLDLSQGPIVPHQTLQGRVELTNIVETSYPRVNCSHTVPTMGIAGSNDEDIGRNRLWK